MSNRKRSDTELCRTSNMISQYVMHALVTLVLISSWIENFVSSVIKNYGQIHKQQVSQSKVHVEA